MPKWSVTLSICSQINTCYNSSSAVRIQAQNGSSYEEAFCQFSDCFTAAFVQSPSNESVCFLAKKLCRRLKPSDDPECKLGVTIPFSRNLQTIFLNSMAWQTSSVPLSLFSGVFCFRSNSLINFFADHNSAWLETLGFTSPELNSSVSGFNDLMNVDIRDNAMQIDLGSLTISQELSTFYYDGNVAPKQAFESLCERHPFLIQLKMSKCGLTVETVTDIAKGCNGSIKEFSLTLETYADFDLEIGLQNCHLTYLSRAFREELDHVGLFELSLLGNPLRCGCDDTELDSINWLRSNHLKITDYDQLTCIALSGDLMPIKHLPHSVLWRLHCPTFIIAVTAVTSLLARSTVSTVVFLCVRYRWRIKYWRFVTSQRLRRTCCTRPASDDGDDENGAGDYAYDAYLAFGNDEMRWVNRTLMPGLEENHDFKTFNRERDMLIGGATSERILDAMATCRRIVLVVSATSAQKEWWRFEMAQALLRSNRAAHDVIITAKRHEVIVVKFEELSGELSADMAHIMDTHACAEWTNDKAGRQLFWAKLAALLRGEDVDGCCVCCRPGKCTRTRRQPITDLHRRTQTPPTVVDQSVDGWWDNASQDGSPTAPTPPPLDDVMTSSQRSLQPLLQTV